MVIELMVFSRRGDRQDKGFTLIEVLSSMGILIAFLTAGMVAFVSVQRLSEGNREQDIALQAARAKMEEMRAAGFSNLETDYSVTGSPGNTFDIANLDGKGSIVLRDVYDDWTKSSGSFANKRGYHTSVVFDDRIWVLGGRAGEPSVWYKDVQSSDDMGVSWNTNTSAAAWAERSNHTSVVFDGKIWVIGGWWGNNDMLNDVWSSPDGAAWTKVTGGADWTRRMGHTSVVFNGKIWVIGGVNAYANPHEYFNDVWSSSDGANWIKVTGGAAWTRRSGHASVVFNGKIWVIGGQDSNGTLKNDVWSSPDGANWTEVTNKADWDPMIGHASVVFDRRIWIIGSEASGQKCQVWYSWDGAKWFQQANAFGNSRIGHSLVVYGGRIFILGGAKESGYAKSVKWSYGADRMYDLDITVSWRQGNGRIVGEDNGANGGTALDGIINGSEDVNGNGILDSPVHLSARIGQRGNYPLRIYMGRE
ncbi:MAG: kelch repeat-containing protein [Candidatus Omnitrophota bacterium]